MIFTTAEKLKIQGQVSQIRFQNKIFTRGPAFSHRSKEAAINFCQNLDNSSCLIVEDTHYLTIWIEKNNQASETKVSENQPAPEPTVDQFFFLRCQQELAELIGPIAPILCQNTLKTFDSNMTEIQREELVNALAQKISNPAQAETFKSRLLS